MRIGRTGRLATMKLNLARSSADADANPNDDASQLTGGCPCQPPRLRECPPAKRLQVQAASADASRFKSSKGTWRRDLLSRCGIEGSLAA
jgi:hypothetical protein